MFWLHRGCVNCDPMKNGYSFLNILYTPPDHTAWASHWKTIKSKATGNFMWLLPLNQYHWFRNETSHRSPHHCKAEMARDDMEHISIDTPTDPYRSRWLGYKNTVHLVKLCGEELVKLCGADTRLGIRLYTLFASTAVCRPTWFCTRACKSLYAYIPNEIWSMSRVLLCAH